MFSSCECLDAALKIRPISLNFVSARDGSFATTPRPRDVFDDDLRRFDANGAAPLPAAMDQGYVEHEGARI